MNEFNSLLKEKNFKKYFGEILGEKNKRIPKEFKKLAEKYPIIANKQFYFFTKLDSRKILEKNFPDTLMKLYHAGKPVNKFLIEGISK